MAVILVAYDIREDERRMRMMRMLLALGYSRVQKSVYIHRRGFEAVKRATLERAARIMDPETDSLLLLTLPDSLYTRAIRMGRGSVDGEVVRL
ncbi:MAG: CRISPR-associated endonuclease Cas2 [Desulfurococcales archaeon]|nr:CRISPR-associated endonuclease Cas2 [Desulfurococcales archaeon]